MNAAVRFNLSLALVSIHLIFLLLVANGPQLVLQDDYHDIQWPNHTSIYF